MMLRAMKVNSILEKSMFTSLCNGRIVWSWQASAGISVQEGEMKSLDVRTVTADHKHCCLYFLYWLAVLKELCFLHYQH